VKRSRLLPPLLALLLALALAPEALGFGKNKVTYSKFDWQVYRSPHFDVHYYEAEEILLQDIVSAAESAYLEISRMLDHEIPFRIPLIAYRTHGDFEQTNIQLAEIPEAVGAFAEPFQNRMVVPMDDPPDQRYKLIKHELTHIFQFDIFYGGSLRRTLRSSPPLWLMEGMASYVADDEDSFDQMIIRDAVVNNVVPSIRQLNVLSFLTYRFGNAIFAFIEENFGEEGLRNFIFEYRKALLANNVDKAVRDSFGWELDEFDRNYHRFLRRKYLPTLIDKMSPDDYGREIGLRKPGQVTLAPALSPSGELVATLATPGLELDVVIMSAETGTIVRNLTKGFTNKYEYVVTNAFSGDGQRDISWSPANDQIAFFVRRENRRILLIYDVLKGKKLATIDPQVDQAASPAFSPDGRSILYAGNRGGLWDIFRMDLETREVTNVTQDSYYDSSPTWSADGKEIVYNRRIGEFAKIFTVDAEDPNRKTQLSFGPWSDIEPVLSRDGKEAFFSSDRSGGIFNLFSVDLETAKVRQLTDVVGGVFAPLEMAPADDGTRRLTFSAFYAGMFRLYVMPIPPKESSEWKEPFGTEAAVPEGERTAPGGDIPEAEPFRPPLQLTLDEEQKRPYKLVWNVDSPSLSAGVANDGTIFTDISVAFTDLLGDHRIFVNSQTVSTFTNISVQYLNFKRRYNWGGAVIDTRDFYNVGDQLGNVESRQTSRVTGFRGIYQYPISRYYRFDANIGGFSRSQSVPVQTGFGDVDFTTIRDNVVTAGVALSGDTVRFQRFGPWSGKRFSLGVNFDKYFGGDSVGGDVTRYSIDYRTYARFTRRSLLAFRLSGVLQYPDVVQPVYFTLGGMNQLRGYEFREFFGDNVAWMNLELRFPLVDSFRLPFGLELGPIRGFWFMDAGTAWFRDLVVCENFEQVPIDPGNPTGPTFPVCTELGKVNAFYNARTGEFKELELYDSDTGRLLDLKASTGLGFHFFLGGLQLNWAFARQFDLKDITGWTSEFYIAYDF
jgi:hypothetical protein